MLSGQVLRDATGAAYAGAKAYYWSDVGLTTPLDTYSDAGLTSANTNPVVADGTTGAFGLIYLSAARYWRTVKTSAGVTLSQFAVGPIDPAPGWVVSSSAPSPTYPYLNWIDTSTSPAHLKRRASDDLSWLDFGPIDGLINAATVTQALAGTSTSVAITPDALAALWQRGTDITTSGGTASLPSTGGKVFNVTGALSAISSAQGGREVIFKAAGAVTWTHNGTSLILPGAANIATVAGDMASFINEGAADASSSNWRCAWYRRASGSPINITDLVAAQTDMETGTSVALAVTPGRQKHHPAHPKAWANFDQVGTHDIAQGSGVTSIADGGTGISTATLTTAQSNATYGIYGSVRAASGSDNWMGLEASGTKTTTTVRVDSVTSAASLEDSTEVNIMILGDQ